MKVDYSMAVELIGSAGKIAVLSGAGISTLSGIVDFRGGNIGSFYSDEEKMKTFDIG